jgi:hypothetical protein
MQFYETESLKYAGRFWKICGSNMQLNMHLHAIICIFIHEKEKTPISVFF